MRSANAAERAWGVGPGAGHVPSGVSGGVGAGRQQGVSSDSPSAGSRGRRVGQEPGSAEEPLRWGGPGGLTESRHRGRVTGAQVPAEPGQETQSPGRGLGSR